MTMLMEQQDKIRDEFSKRLAQALTEAGYPKHGRGMKLAHSLGVTSKAVSKWLSGESLPRPAMMLKLANMIKVDPLWLQHGQIAQDSTLKFNSTIFKSNFILLPWENIDEWSDAILTHSDSFDWYASGVDVHPQQAFWLKVQDETMTSPVGLCVPKGSLILVDTVREPKNEDLVIAKLPQSNKATFKQLVIDSGVDRKYLRPLDRNLSPTEIDANCVIYGVVVESRMNFVTPDIGDTKHRFNKLSSTPLRPI